jgi:hypothetical protein
VSAVDVLDAERIKLSTTRSVLWTSAAIAVLSMGLAALQGSTAYGASSLPPEKAALGVAVFGVPLLMVLAAMTVTGEYRSGMIRTTFMATPNRTLVLIAKAVVAAMFSAVYAAALTIAAVLVGRLMAPLVGSNPSLVDPGTWRLVGAISLFAALAAVLGVGVGALLRHAAGAVAVLLMWPLVVEPILGNLPNIGSEVGPHLPFGNAFLFTRVQWLYPAYDMPWGEFGSLLYFAAVVSVVFAAAIVVVNRRDA